ncbi:ubiquitin specific protease 14 [Arctopsyche grandis]|uniref:ubiquitin specific protease 14 n=1 Tax=Arctopsyche grandis TaxID=121162 RepID=UPI00406D949F
MPSFTVKVKWGKELYQGVEVNTDEPPILFKAQIFALTGVQPDRQKVMCKGATLKDEEWGNVKLSNGAMILVMGSKEEDVPVEPAEKPVFVEDMTETELASALDLPGGLVNLGNTCYMNATVQCLKTVPELRDSLKKFELAHNEGPTSSLVGALRDTLQIMEKSTQIPPFALLASLHAAIPRFKEREPAGHGGAGGSMGGGGGGLAQQDANECWTEMVRILQQKLPTLEGTNKTVIDQYFGGKLDVEMKCAESEDEPISNSDESFLQLSCFISQDVKYLQSGLKSKMQEQITKMSSVLERDAVFTKTSKLSRLPAYLTVQFVRFYYKEKEAINAKILKDVKFPLDLDVYELCSPKLQEKLMPMRSKFKIKDDAKVEEALAGKEKEKENKGKMPMIVKKDDKLKKYAPFSFDDDVGSNNSGFYSLQAVLTHRGRSSSSGHYVAWVRWNSAQKSDQHWLKCDDDDITPVTDDDVLKLSGGGDWHCAYVLLYGPRRLEEDSDDASTSNKMDTA